MIKGAGVNAYMAAAQDRLLQLLMDKGATIEEIVEVLTKAKDDAEMALELGWRVAAAEHGIDPTAQEGQH
jgi:hypothetical protein